MKRGGEKEGEKESEDRKKHVYTRPPRICTSKTFTIYIQSGKNRELKSRPSSKGTKLLFQVIKAVNNQSKTHTCNWGCWRMKCVLIRFYLAPILTWTQTCPARSSCGIVGRAFLRAVSLEYMRTCDVLLVSRCMARKGHDWQPSLSTLCTHTHTHTHTP